MAEIRPRLKIIGSFGLSIGIKYVFVKIPLGLRRRVVVQVDDSRGARSWKLVYKVLPGTLDTPVTLDNGDLQSQADYLWEFFCARKEEGDGTFIITCPRDSKNYLVAFADDELTYEMFMTKLFSTGLTLIQVDETDVALMEDGSLAEETGNNAKI